MEAAPSPSRRVTRRRMLILAIAVLCSYAFFYEGGGWNQNTRFDLTREIIVHRTLSIDDYGDNTGDKARVGGHTFIDKAPGASLTAVPAIAVARSLMRRAGVRVDTVEAIDRLSYIATLVACALPAVLAVLAVFWVSRHTLGCSDDAAGIAALAFGLGSPLWAYAIVFFGHALCAGCLMAALAAACALRSPRDRRSAFALGAMVGVGAGWATVSEYPCLVPAALLAVFAIANARSANRAAVIPVACGIAATAFLCAGVLLWYNWRAFGHPLTISYTHFDDPVVMKSGFFDIVGPDWRLLPQLLFGWYRGLVPLSPILLVVPIGLVSICRDRQTRALGILSIVALMFAVLLNMSYLKWTGGWNYGPRHMTWALGFAYLAIAPVWDRAGRNGRAVLVLLTAAGMISALLAVSTTVQPPDHYLHPMRELWWPAFSNGLLSLNRQTFLDFRPQGGAFELLMDGAPRAAWNVGQVLGLPGVTSLLPLMGLWTLAAALWRRARTSEIH